jgi:hypothetical protein
MLAPKGMNDEQQDGRIKIFGKVYLTMLSIALLILCPLISEYYLFTEKLWKEPVKI